MLNPASKQETAREILIEVANVEQIDVRLEEEDKREEQVEVDMAFKADISALDKTV